jgi:alpha-tubulin suppressor-like RCC1 family protein
MHSGCIDSQGYCYTWGSAQYGQLGQGNSVISKKKTCVPDRVTLDNGDPLIATWLSCGGMHTAAIDTDGDVWCWGRSDSGQTGCNKWIQTFVPFVSHPEKLPPFESAAVSVRCGGFHTMVVTKDGRVYSMGKEDFGMLGINCISDSSEVTVDGYSYNPRLVAALEGHHVVGVSCGGWHSLFWTKNGDLFACGKGEYGRLGLLNEESVTTPQLVKLDDGIKIHTASAGGSHSLIVDTKGVLYVVGRADDGRLGLETLSPNDHRVLQVQPLHIDGGRKVLCVAAGGSHSLVVTNVDEHFSQEISSEIVDMR